MSTETDLRTQHCQSCEGIGLALTRSQVEQLKTQLNATWQIAPDAKKITRSFSFKNFYETMAFVNALAFIAHIENHHPDLDLGYNYCHVSFTTHALGGLSMNDFICASKIDALIFF